MGYRVLNVDEVVPAGPGGAVRFVRRRLGVEAFGVNWYELPPNAELRFDPETTRCPVAGPEGMTFIAIGACRGSYEARGPF